MKLMAKYLSTDCREVYYNDLSILETSGDFEFLTVIPSGNWFTYEHAGKPQRMTLRRHIIMMFHFTPHGPHMGRDRTVQSILDAGLWQSLYKDVQALCRTCLVCQAQKNAPLITGHQRSREYDGPFRYLIIDYVGPMNPPSRRDYWLYLPMLLFGVNGIGLHRL